MILLTMQKDLIHSDEVFSGAGNEARTRLPASHKWPASICGNPASPRIQNALRAYRWRPRVRAENSMQKDLIHSDEVFSGAGNEARTRYLHLGKVALYQMSYARENKVYSSR